ncbi:hypothetical protein PGTUg99_020943 [Puccinia graminis f. sp. tritici]|uniref:Uncharacterized protein n=1 Tax=Puccinia graminis f. sp. tritici TaxID=56615 RepID=A0A5B0R539_PUCGR|nr:hypothetical protein PGTUg99_020943 [Puccinia graminis f. sp. tritici]
MFPKFARGGALGGAIRHVELGLVKLGVPGPRKELKPPAALAVPRIGSSDDQGGPPRPRHGLPLVIS